MAIIPSAYLAAMRAARLRGLAVDARAAGEIEKALRQWADELARGINNLPANQRLAARRSVEVVRGTARDLEKRIVATTGKSIEVTVEETLDVWSDASRAVAASEGIPNALMGAVSRPELTTAQAFLSKNPAATWRTLVRSRVNEAEKDVTRIVSGALTRGVGPEQLATALRPYVTGRDRLPEPIAAEIEGQPASTRLGGFTMDHNAKRIAFSESHNARREAEVAHFTADPLVALVQWTLSPRRGTQRTADACDALALLDWYGYGAGVFPLSAVPLSPHPWDRCEVVPIVRKVSEVGRSKPTHPKLQLDPLDVPLPGQSGMTAAAEERTRLVLVAVLSTHVRAA